MGGVRARWCSCWLVYGSPPLTIAPIYRFEGWAYRSDVDERHRGIRLGVIEGVPVGVRDSAVGACYRAASEHVGWEDLPYSVVGDRHANLVAYSTLDRSLQLP